MTQIPHKNRAYRTLLDLSHKVKKALALVMIWLARHLCDEPVLAVGSLSRDKQRSISQLLLSKRQCSCSQQVGLLRVSTVYICEIFSIASSQ